MGLWRRIVNLVRAIVYKNVKELEVEHAEAVYDAAIQKKIENFHQLKRAVGALVARREKLGLQLEQNQREYRQVRQDLEAAIATNDTKLGPLLLQKKEQLELAIERFRTDLEQARNEVEEYKTALTEMQGGIETLKSEREHILAQAASDRERIRIENELAGLSVEPELAALDNVRDGLAKMHGEAVISKELGETDVDRQLSKLRRTGAPVAAKSRFAELVKQSQATKETATGSTATPQQEEVKKTLGSQESNN